MGILTVSTEATSLLQPDNFSLLTDARVLELESPRKDARPGASHLGLLSVTCSAVLFGLVAALVKSIAMDPYVVLELRDTSQWLFSLAAVSAFVPAGRTTAKLFGEPRHRMILFLRSGLYWGFTSLFWMALGRMPVGDVTAIVYCSPIFTALFGWLLLGERVSPRVFGCLALSMVGVSLITQPAFLFGHGSDETDE